MTIATASPVTAYAESVVAGEVVTGRLVRLACARHLRDLETGAQRGLRFDEDLAQRAIDFFRVGLKLAEGEFEGQPFILQPWQAFIVGSLFGWLGPDGFRRFRRAYVEAGKGSGKSPLAAGIGLYCLTADGESAAEVYAAAVTRDQAKISFTDAVRMVTASPNLSRRVEVLLNNLRVKATDSIFRPLSSEARALDGKRVHCAIIDEIHEHRDGIVVEKMRAGTKARRQALIFEITNSGYDRETICFQEHDYSSRILEGIIDNDAWFAYVCQLDPCDECRMAGKVSPSDGCGDCDDWRDEAVWLKANPSLEVTPGLKYLREQVSEAVGMPSKRSIVQRLNFCMWTSSVTRWLNPDQWEVNALPPRSSLAGRECYAGLDLSSTTDLTSLELWFPDKDDPSDGQGDVLSFCWVPEDSIMARSRNDGVPYDLWARDGYIEATEGPVVNYDVVVERIKTLGNVYHIREIGIDPWNAAGVEVNLMAAGFKVVRVVQAFSSLSAPSKQLERLVKLGKLRHDGNPVLRWAASNVTVDHDAYDNIRPSKAKSTERIDPVVALVMAIGRQLANGEEASIGSQIFL